MVKRLHNNIIIIILHKKADIYRRMQPHYPTGPSTIAIMLQNWALSTSLKEGYTIPSICLADDVSSQSPRPI